MLNDRKINCTSGVVHRAIDRLGLNGKLGLKLSYYAVPQTVYYRPGGYAGLASRACAPIAGPTGESRIVLRDFLDEQGFEFVIGDGYYAFLNVKHWLEAGGYDDSAELGEYLAQEHGIAVVPGVYFSQAGADWLRFSYALPPERTAKAAERLLAGLNALK